MNTQLAGKGYGSGYLAQDWSERAGIGSHKGQRFLMGAMDEVYIYTSALTQNQIRDLACICEDSKGVWPLFIFFKEVATYGHKCSR